MIGLLVRWFFGPLGYRTLEALEALEAKSSFAAYNTSNLRQPKKLTDQISKTL